ncbi:hypothetical protein FA95DRAFT_68773 [Auriscalpium vulgare]|uniref:Uncharacterized protein n=1 Tax=Auriscalpium vulgare TaxID=40419 RepID=A0ACB8S896_9AGAM|nr:hypothetical protein FA95DRAFT_68773 [Auriscalpium vulgare]
MRGNAPRYSSSHLQAGASGSNNHPPDPGPGDSTADVSTANSSPAELESGGSWQAYRSAEMQGSPYPPLEEFLRNFGSWPPKLLGGESPQRPEGETSRLTQTSASWLQAQTQSFPSDLPLPPPHTMMATAAGSPSPWPGLGASPYIGAIPSVRDGSEIASGSVQSFKEESVAGSSPQDAMTPASSLGKSTSTRLSTRRARNTGPYQGTTSEGHTCECGPHVFERLSDLRRHRQTARVHGGNGHFECEECLTTFTRHDALLRHKRKQHTWTLPED